MRGRRVHSAGANMRSAIPDAAIDNWRRDGAVLVEGVFTHDELAPVLEDYRRVHPVPATVREAATHEKLGERIGQFDKGQFRNFLNYPFATSLATNLLPLHPVLIDGAQRMLGVRDVFMY